MKIGIFSSHPIQNQVPLFKKLAKQKEVELKVFFGWNYGVREKFDKDFGRPVAWDIPLLEGYDYALLSNFSLRPSSRSFWGMINPRIVGEIIQGKFGVFIVFGWHGVTNWLSFFCCMVSGIPIFLRAENPLNQESLKTGIGQSIKKIILTTLFEKVSVFLYIGEENRKFYKQYGVPDKKLVFCPYAVDNERFFAAARELSPRKDALKKELGLDAEQRVITFAGKLIPKKRPMDLLRAFERLRGLGQNAALVFIGDGPLKKELEEHALRQGIQNVFFVGFKNQTEISACYALSDIFVLPSGPGETWGLVVNEAMCFGLPVIVSHLVGSAADLVRDGVNGYVFECGNIDGLARCLRIVVADEKKRKVFGRKSKEIIEAYSYHKDVAGILDAVMRIENQANG